MTNAGQFFFMVLARRACNYGKVHHITVIGIIARVGNSICFRHKTHGEGSKTHILDDTKDKEPNEKENIIKALLVPLY